MGFDSSALKLFNKAIAQNINRINFCILLKNRLKILYHGRFVVYSIIASNVCIVLPEGYCHADATSVLMYVVLR